ncbi:MAG: FAD-dependent oxidoreductase [Betaproteobacteria bacterium]|nr:FAD-dependent oxidoreductase [Betaproteobacteria bacterium]
MNEPSPAAAQLAADVVVIGGGGSGLAAAIEAASLGRSVVLVEKAARLGGSTALSVGSITATNTPQQLRQGILDSPQAHFEDLQKFNQGVGLADNAKLSRLLVDNVPETVRWLMSMGVEFHGPMNELPHRKPRMHVVLPNSRAYIFHLGRRARALGVDIRTSVRASAFIVADGRVTGIRCQTPDGPLEIHARGGVVLCSGDYSASEDKRARYLGSHMKAVNPVNIHNTGDGQDMVEALGGSVVNRQLYLAGIRFQAPPAKWIHNLPPNRLLTRCMRLMLERLPGAIVRPFIMSFLTGILVPSPKLLQSGAMLVNRNGERFGDELDAPGPRIAQQPEQIAYLVFDAKLAARFSGWPNYVSTAPGFAYASIADYRRNRKDIFHEAATLEALAASIGVPAAALTRTVAEYNTSPERERTGRMAADRGPYVAIGPVRYLINFTDGGVAVSDELQVLGKDGQPVPGLYAAGFSGMGGVLLEGHGHHLGWAFTSGRLAGRKAAYNVATADIPEAAGAQPASH